jgi:DNA-binding CsgD family transcriptional regulator
MNRFELQPIRINQYGSIIESRVKSGERLRDVCKSYGILYNGALKILIEHGFDVSKKQYIPDKQIIITDEQIDKIVCLLKDNEESLLNIAKQHGLNYYAYYNAIRKKYPDLLTRKKTTKTKNRISSAKEILSQAQQIDIIHAYSQEHKSSYDISRIYGISVNTVLRVLKTNKVKLNNQSIYWTEDRRAASRKKNA